LNAGSDQSAEGVVANQKTADVDGLVDGLVQRKEITGVSSGTSTSEKSESAGVHTDLIMLGCS
jgi:hypothetical protein